MKIVLLYELLLVFSILIVISGAQADAKLSPASGIGFQGSESSGIEEHVSFIQNLDGNWAPPTSANVPFDYYATGIDTRFWDALSVKFNTGAYNPSEYKAVLRFYAQSGSYNTQWNHYIILQGDRNPTYQDADWEVVANDPKVKSLGSGGSWFEEELPGSYWNSGSFWVTMRMWNVRVDAVELVLIPNEVSSITVTSPNGGETWVHGSTHDITWTSSGNVGSNVRIELLKGGSVYRTLANTLNDGSCSWTLLDAEGTGTDYRVRITSTTNPAITDMSNGYFTITAASQDRADGIYFDYQNIDSLSREIGTNIRILTDTPSSYYAALSWTGNGDGYGYYGIQSEGGQPQERHVHFTVWNTNDGKITTVIEKANDVSCIYDCSEGCARVCTWKFDWSEDHDYKLVVKAENVGEATHYQALFYQDETSPPKSIVTVAFQKKDVWIKDVSTFIEDFGYHPNCVSPYRSMLVGKGYRKTLDNNILQLSSARYVPIGICSERNAEVRSPYFFAETGSGVVEQLQPGSILNINDPQTSRITVTSPNGGETWIHGSTHDITWTSLGNVGSNVRIELLKGGSVYRTLANTLNDGSCSWTLLDAEGTGTDYRVRITSTTNPAITDTSDSNFSINPKIPDGTITVTSPNGGETWNRGSTQSITWSYTGNPGSTVKIVLLAEGQPLETIADSTSIGSSGIGSYTWSLSPTGSTGSDYKIMISSVTQPAIHDESNGYFTIGTVQSTPTITVTAPNGGETWQQSTSDAITWSYTGNPGSNVNIALFKGNAFLNYITTNVPIGSSGTGSYTWQIPSGTAIGSDYKIGVQSVSQTNIYDLSNNNFAITSNGGFNGGTGIGVFRPGTAQWSLDMTRNFAWDISDTSLTWGQPGDIPLIGDWNGDGNKKIGVFRPGTAQWILDYNGNRIYDSPTVDKVASFGQVGFNPVVGDWDGTGKDKIGVQKDGIWAIDYNGNYVWDGAVTDRFAAFGQTGDIPVVGDWDNSGKDKIGSHKDGFWSIDYNGNYVWEGAITDRFAGFGQTADKPVVGDWNGDGKDKIGMEINGFWATDYNGNFAWDGAVTDRFAGFGSTNDKPIVGDWDNTGTAKIGSFKNGFWSVDYNGNYVWDGAVTDRFAGFGQIGDTPVVAKWS